MIEFRSFQENTMAPINDQAVAHLLAAGQAVTLRAKALSVLRMVWVWAMLRPQKWCGLQIT